MEEAIYKYTGTQPALSVTFLPPDNNMIMVIVKSACFGYLLLEKCQLV